MAVATRARRRARLTTLGLIAALFGAFLPAPLSAPPVAAVTPGSAGKIVFVSSHERNPSTDLYTMDPDGSDVTRITTDTPDPTAGLQYLEPTWSPDGTKIVAFRISSGSDLVTMNADGSGLAPVLEDVAAFAPTWSPDGLTLFFADNLVGTTSPGHLWKVGVDGNGLTQLTIGDNQDGDPTVNPAGTKIAFVRNGAIGTANTDGSGFVELTPSVTNAEDPSWSPDGTKIAFSRQFQGIWTVNPDGSGLVKLGPGTWLSDARQPAWSPDGMRILVTRTGGFGRGIASMNGEASCVSSLFEPTEPDFAQHADWQPVANPTLFRFPTPAGCPKVFRGISKSMTINVTRSGGFTGPNTLAATSLPPGMTATFSPNPATGSTSTMTVNATECPDTTPSGGHRLTITGVNGGSERTGYVDVIVDDGLPRITHGPTSTLVAGKTAASGKVPVKTSWLGCDADNSLTYIVQRWKASKWTTQSTSPSTTLTQSLAYATKYRYRVRARDGNDDQSPYANGRYFEPRLTQQTSGSVNYSGTWKSSSSSNYLGGSTRLATAANASARYTFTGASIAWVGAVGPTRGAAQVYIDGVLKATVDTHAASVKYRQTLYAFNWSSQGSHTIKIVVVGTAGHARVDVDAFVRLYRT
jgi:Tol biopolymer transport system component